MSEKIPNPLLRHDGLNPLRAYRLGRTVTFASDEMEQAISRAVAAILADGWYAGYVGYGNRRHHYGKDLRLLAQVLVEYEDGTKEIVSTGPSWRAAQGPLVDDE